MAALWEAGLWADGLWADGLWSSDNPPPTVINPIPDQEIINGNAFAYVVPANTFSDDGALALTARLVGGAALSEANLSFNGTQFGGIPTADSVVDIEVIATDAQSQQVSDIFLLTSSDTPNQPSQIDNPIPDQVAQAGVDWSYTWANVFSDPDGDALIHPSEVTGGFPLPSVGISYNEPSRTYAASSPPVQTVSIDLYANDGQNTVIDTFQVDFTLQTPNLIGDVFSLGLTQTQAMNPIDLSALANGLPDTYESIGSALPSGITLTNGIISGVPDTIGSTTGIQFRISNAAGSVDTAVITISVSAPSASVSGSAIISKMFLDA